MKNSIGKGQWYYYLEPETRKYISIGMGNVTWNMRYIISFVLLASLVVSQDLCVLFLLLTKRSKILDGSHEHDENPNNHTTSKPNHCPSYDDPLISWKTWKN